MKIVVQFIAMFALFLTIGCGSSSSGNIGSDEKSRTNTDRETQSHDVAPYDLEKNMNEATYAKVEYILDGTKDPKCLNATHVSRSKDNVMCQWTCGEYNGEKPLYVELSFDRGNDGVWTFNQSPYTSPVTSLSKCRDQ